MREDLVNLKKVGETLVNKMGIKTNNQVRFGFGSFVDRPITPFVHHGSNSCEGVMVDGVERNTTENPCPMTYTFKNNVQLTSSYSEFNKTFQEVDYSGNIDIPEDGLTALVQENLKNKQCVSKC